jgi:UDP-N-acetylglucosamine 2-epimerase (non-hydrolysing)
MAEVIRYYQESIESSEILKHLNLHRNSFFVVSLHREENVDNPKRLCEFINMLNSLAAAEGLPLVVSTHPRTRKRLNELNVDLHPLIRLVEPLSFTDYVHLQMGAVAVLSDSGTISEESSILKFPAVNLRDSHERPEAMEQANVMMVSASFERLQQALAILSRRGTDVFSLTESPTDYKAINVAEKVSRIIHSYVDIVGKIYQPRS